MNKSKKCGEFSPHFFCLNAPISEKEKYLCGSDNICIRKKKKFGGKNLVEAPVCGALAFLEGKFMQKWKMVGIGGKWSKIGFYFA